MEVDHLTLQILGLAITVYWVLFYYIGFVAATLVTSFFWVPLWLYIGAYRAFFHALNVYPGPWAAKLSRWWTVKQTYDSGLHYHRVLQRLQSRYGDYVRTGLSNLCFWCSCDSTNSGSTIKYIEGSFLWRHGEVFTSQPRQGIPPPASQGLGQRDENIAFGLCAAGRELHRSAAYTIEKRGRKIHSTVWVRDILQLRRHGSTGFWQTNGLHQRRAKWCRC